MPEWTPRQKEAIETGGKNLLVAAAAGSRKTAVLVERIIQQVLGGACDVDKLLVMTFTDAAAREMRQRVESSLEKALEAEMDPKRAAQIERQLVLLSGASISTIHKFCIRVLQRHFEAIDLDPEFRIGNEQELALLRQDVIEQLFEEEYDKGTASFLQFVDDYGDDRGDDDLYALVERVECLSPLKNAVHQPLPVGAGRAFAIAVGIGHVALAAEFQKQESVGCPAAGAVGKCVGHVGFKFTLRPVGAEGAALVNQGKVVNGAGSKLAGRYGGPGRHGQCSGKSRNQ